MKLEVAKALAEADQIAGQIIVREGYSGRGMYGETTAAVVFDDQRALLLAVAAVAYDMGSLTRIHECDEFMGDLARLRFDDLGRGKVAY